MWPSNPNIKVMPQGAAPSSPPLSPGSSRKGSPWHGPMPSHGQFSPPPMPSITVRRLVGLHGLHGPSFSFTRAIDPDQLSPQSRSTSSETSSDSDDDDLGTNSLPRSMQPSPSPSRSPSPPPIRPGRVVTNPNLIVEEMSDGSDDEDENAGVSVIYPDTIEYAESERSRSRSRRHRGEIYENVMHELGQLNCSDDDSTDIEEAEHHEMVRRQREERRRKRMTSGSVGKRTFAESMGSDSDREDPRDFKRLFTSAGEEPGPYCTPRRMFTRVGDRRRGGVQVVSEPMPPPPPRIDEIEEPDSSNEEILVDESTWSRELPSYECVMDIDSP
ncbi:hypothetical protein SMACR_03662 [Sordaria macrospora]|uniref:WGS project CABT00000000 data, contig 2.9 n=2 Tax=Sordaria macrospora TaxID=5147 RepID=F7VVT9_SORMK|nr:uncharacterized protein SMAC_03662 [Sordaria macrospora k-hell]KAA8635122.1 hypothetical protein SMACR_03662 [Sordaria macrospora]KAH7625732.1 hypothetical protein B0T09DRAFT_56920 [Sordaria sp. MPI-SDFR-AT-0083]WPJ66057.1 hypothetical protein SMAC4_03662 [Sordaria macrospora]CCC09630.1 unnamed protein product [Sordaria macrospora k-hell]